MSSPPKAVCSHGRALGRRASRSYESALVPEDDDETGEGAAEAPPTAVDDERCPAPAVVVLGRAPPLLAASPHHPHPHQLYHSRSADISPVVSPTAVVKRGLCLSRRYRADDDLELPKRTAKRPLGRPRRMTESAVSNKRPMVLSEEDEEEEESGEKRNANSVRSSSLKSAGESLKTTHSSSSMPDVPTLRAINEAAEEEEEKEEKDKSGPPRQVKIPAWRSPTASGATSPTSEPKTFTPVHKRVLLTSERAVTRQRQRSDSTGSTGVKLRPELAAALATLREQKLKQGQLAAAAAAAAAAASSSSGGSTSSSPTANIRPCSAPTSPESSRGSSNTSPLVPRSLPHHSSPLASPPTTARTGRIQSSSNGYTALATSAPASVLKSAREPCK